jgi:myosin-1
MPPHVYCIGDNAFKGLSFKSGPNQSIIISGESGAGKTEAAKLVVNYVSSIAGSTSGIEQFLFV